MTSTLNVTSPGLVQSTEEMEIVPDAYISSVVRMNQFLEWRAAFWIDYIYVPLCSGLGIIGNVLSFCVLLSPRMSGTSTSVYMAALAFSDTLVQVSNILWLARKFPGHEVLRHGTCGLVYFVFFFSIHYSVIVMVGMTMERYLAIRFPLKASRWCTPKKAKVVVVIMSVAVVALNFHNLVLRKMVWNDSLKTEVCSTEGATNQFFLFKVWPWIDSSVYYNIPVVTIILLNVLIVRQMRAAHKFRGTSGASEQDDVGRQVTVVLLLVTCMFLLLVGPVGVVLVVERYVWIRTTLHQNAVYHLIRTIVNNLCYTSHAINFILYSLSGNRFRQAFLQMFFPCFTSESSSSKEKQSVSMGKSSTPASDLPRRR